MRFQCQHLSKEYPTRNGPVEALREVNVSAREGEFLCIVGPSGCGKTTLLKLIAGLEKPTSGRIVLAGEHSGQRWWNAMVFQEHGLFPWMTVLDNVAFGLEMQGVGKEARRERARTFIERVGLASFGQNYPHELSVGMRQRAAIARAFVTDSQVLLMDEPFGSLDTQTRMVLQEELLGIWKDQRNLIVYITHDIKEAVIMGDRVLVMTGRPGRIREEIAIPLDRPRELSLREQPKIADLEWQIWKLIEEEVRKGLRMAR